MSQLNMETIMGIIPDVKLKISMAKSLPILLIITNHRLIIFHRTPIIDRKITEVYTKHVESLGFKERLKANLSSFNQFNLFFQDKGIEDILTMNPKSTYVEYDDILHLRFPGLISIGNHENLYRLRIETPLSTYDIFFDPQKNHLYQARQLFKSLIPDKVS
jgi:hypothetical protein